MNDKTAASEYLVISRGQWDKDASREAIQGAIDEFYLWHARLVAQGKMRAGQRLAREGKTVSRHMVTDGPFIETREVIGGYWFILAGSLDEAAKIAAGNPCLACGLVYEIRPINPARASAFTVTTETPQNDTIEQPCLRTTMDTPQFEAELIRDGFGVAIAGDYAPGRINHEHTHPFEVRGLVLSGEMAITVAGESQTYGPGAVFVMHPGQTHREDVGADGVRYLYGSRPAAA